MSFEKKFQSAKNVYCLVLHESQRLFQVAILIYSSSLNILQGDELNGKVFYEYKSIGKMHNIFEYVPKSDTLQYMFWSTYKGRIAYLYLTLCVCKDLKYFAYKCNFLFVF